MKKLKFTGVLSALVLVLLWATGCMAASLPVGFVYLDEVTDIAWDARYATGDNFTGAPVTGYQANRIVISKAMQQPLIKAEAIAQAIGYKLLIWDAARPQRAVDRFVAWSQEAEDNKTKVRHYPDFNDKELLFEQGFIARRSGHSRGAAVDLTLTDSRGKLLDMGTPFDFFGLKSHQGAAGLNAEQQRNRQQLVEIMTTAGFVIYPEEWWHYILATEPYPQEYFDFVIEDQ